MIASLGAGLICAIFGFIYWEQIASLEGVWYGFILFTILGGIIFAKKLEGGKLNEKDFVDDAEIVAMINSWGVSGAIIFGTICFYFLFLIHPDLDHDTKYAFFLLTVFMSYFGAVIASSYQIAKKDVNPEGILEWLKCIWLCIYNASFLFPLILPAVVVFISFYTFFMLFISIVVGYFTLVPFSIITGMFFVGFVLGEYYKTIGIFFYTHGKRISKRIVRSLYVISIGQIVSYKRKKQLERERIERKKKEIIAMIDEVVKEER